MSFDKKRLIFGRSFIGALLVVSLNFVAGVKNHTVVDYRERKNCCRGSVRARRAYFREESDR